MVEYKSLWFDGVEYKPIPSRPKCYASHSGIIVTTKRPTPVFQTGSKDRDGYCFVSKPKQLVHHLILEAWGFPRPIGSQVRHLNGIPNDNRLCNLKWGTAKENMSDKFLHGTTAKGETNAASKMTESFVLSLREQYINKPLTRICLENPQYSKFALWAAVSGYTWKHLPNAINGNRKCSKEGWRNGMKIRI